MNKLLKRQNINCIIYETKYSEIIIEKDLEKIENLKKSGLEHITIYNPNKETKKELEKMFVEIIKNQDDVKTQIDVTSDIIITKFLPMLSDSFPEFDESNEDILKEAIDDPSPLFFEMIQVISNIIYYHFVSFLKNTMEISKIPQELREQFLEKVE